MTTIGLHVEAPDTVHGRLWRALRDDAAFPFVVIGGDADAGGRYTVAGEHGTPDVEGGVQWIAPLDGADADVPAAWEAARAVLAARRGYLGARLYRSADGAAPAWIDVARWSSPLMVHRARQDPPAAAALAAPLGALYLPAAWPTGTMPGGFQRPSSTLRRGT